MVSFLVVGGVAVADGRSSRWGIGTRLQNTSPDVIKSSVPVWGVPGASRCSSTLARARCGSVALVVLSILVHWPNCKVGVDVCHGRAEIDQLRWYSCGGGPSGRMEHAGRWARDAELADAQDEIEEAEKEGRVTAVDDALAVVSSRFAHAHLCGRVGADRSHAGHRPRSARRSPPLGAWTLDERDTHLPAVSASCASCWSPSSKRSRLMGCAGVATGAVAGTCGCNRNRGDWWCFRFEVHLRKDN